MVVRTAARKGGRGEKGKKSPPIPHTNREMLQVKSSSVMKPGYVDSHCNEELRHWNANAA